MKKTILLLTLSGLTLLSCKKNEKKETVSEKTTVETIITTPKFSVNTAKSTVSWTAYKTTKKIEVNGTFTEINIKKIIKSDTPQGTLDNLQFNIPVSSFFSKNESRDTKIKTLFFGIMKKTTALSGHFSDIKGDDTKGKLNLNLKMNNNTVAVPMKYTITNNVITLNGKITNLMDWKIEEAFTSLHKSCEQLHTGADGVSETGKDVTIQANIAIRSN